MSEITKLYKNANIEKEVIKGCYDYYSKLGIDIWKENDCSGKNCNTCKKDKSIKRYPPFTAEKQIAIFKMFCKRYLTVSQHVEENGDLCFGIVSTVGGSAVFNKDFAECLAAYVNCLWQYLTPEEKQQVKGILE